VLEALLEGGDGGGVSCPRLEALFLGGNDISESGGASAMVVRAAKELPSLKLFSVPNNELGWVVGGPLASAVRSRASSGSGAAPIRVLDVRGNACTTVSLLEAACALAGGLVGADAVTAARSEAEAAAASGEAEGEPEGGDSKGASKSARTMTTREKDEAELDTTVPRLLLDDNTCSEGGLGIIRAVMEAAGCSLGSTDLLDLFEDEDMEGEERAKLEDEAGWATLMVAEEA